MRYVRIVMKEGQLSQRDRATHCHLKSCWLYEKRSFEI